MEIGYARVSTPDQSMNLQRDARLRHAKGLFNPNPKYPRPAPGAFS